jgi:hypothetical protein
MLMASLLPAGFADSIEIHGVATRFIRQADPRCAERTIRAAERFEMATNDPTTVLET